MVAPVSSRCCWQLASLKVSLCAVVSWNLIDSAGWVRERKGGRRRVFVLARLNLATVVFPYKGRQLATCFFKNEFAFLRGCLFRFTHHPAVTILACPLDQTHRALTKEITPDKFGAHQVRLSNLAADLVLAHTVGR